MRKSQRAVRRKTGLTQIDQDIAARASQRGQQEVRTAMRRQDQNEYLIMECDTFAKTGDITPAQRVADATARYEYFAH